MSLVFPHELLLAWTSSHLCNKIYQSFIASWFSYSKEFSSRTCMILFFHLDIWSIWSFFCMVWNMDLFYLFPNGYLVVTASFLKKSIFALSFTIFYISTSIWSISAFYTIPLIYCFFIHQYQTALINYIDFIVYSYVS